MVNRHVGIGRTVPKVWRKLALASAAVLSALIWVTPVHAGAAAPVAIVEDIAAPSTKLQVMDYLMQGAVIVLVEGESLNISYFDSCAIERIIGGTVTVGKRKSTVRGKSRIKRKFVECGGANMVLTGRQAGRAAGVVMRAGKPGEKAPEVTVHSRTPVFVFSAGANELVIESMDRGRAAPQRFAVKGRSVDLAKLGVTLKAGGLYNAKAGDRSVVFKIANTARSSARSVVGRLVGL